MTPFFKCSLAHGFKIESLNYGEIAFFPPAAVLIMAHGMWDRLTLKHLLSG